MAAQGHNQSHNQGGGGSECDVPLILSSAAVWSPIPYPEIGSEETFY